MAHVVFVICIFVIAFHMILVIKVNGCITNGRIFKMKNIKFLIYILEGCVLHIC